MGYVTCSGVPDLLHPNEKSLPTPAAIISEAAEIWKADNLDIFNMLTLEVCRKPIKKR